MDSNEETDTLSNKSIILKCLLQQRSGDQIVKGIHPLGTSNVCTKCHVNPSVSCWSISLTTTNVDLMLHSRKSQMICKLNFLFVSKKSFFCPKHAQPVIPVFPSHPQPLSLSSFFWHWPSGAVSLLWSSSSSSFCPAGGARKGDKGTGTRRIAAKKEKTRLCGKTKRKETGEKKSGDRKKNDTLCFSLAGLTLGIGHVALLLAAWGFLFYWTIHFNPKSGPLDGQLSLTGDKLKMNLCVE